MESIQSHIVHEPHGLFGNASQSRTPRTGPAAEKTCEQHAAAHGQTQGNRPYLGHQHPSEDQTAQTDTQPQQRNASLGLHRIAETQLCGGTSHVLRQPDQFDSVAGIQFRTAPHGDLHTRPHDGPDIDPVHEFSRQDLSDPLPGSPLAIDHDRKDLNGKIRQCRRTLRHRSTSLR